MSDAKRGKFEWLKRLLTSGPHDAASNRAPDAPAAEPRAPLPSAASDTHHLLRPPAPARPPRWIDATLGIDFGTRFTKVVLQLPHLDKSAALSLASGTERLFPSRIALLGELAYPPDLPAPPGSRWQQYLKMRLAGELPGVLPDEVHPLKGVTTEGHAAFAALYLSGVLRLARRAAVQQGHVTSDAPVRWSAQVGAPAQTYDSPDLSLFEEVCAVAWSWQDDEPRAWPVTDLVAAYRSARASRKSREELPISVAPELSAAIFHFASRADAPEGLYAFLDIGGGTLDGTVFSLRRTPNLSVDILAAKVQRLGTIPVAHCLVTKTMSIEDAERRLITERLGAGNRTRLRTPEQQVRRLLHEVVAKAVCKVSPSQFVSFGHRSDLDRRIGTGGYHSVPLMVAGGGAPSEWYRGIFESHAMKPWLIEGFRVRTVDRPTGAVEDDYPRFVVARGLSRRELQLRMDCRLPGQIPAAPPLSAREPLITAPISKDMV